MIKIICEIGCNWNNLKEAKKMIDKSKKIGAFLCKFQIYNDKIIKNNPDQEFLKSIMITKDMAKILFEYGKKIGQEVFFSCMTPEGVEWCEEIGINYYKIRFFDRNNLILYRKIKKTKVPIFVSCNDTNDTIYSNIAQYQKRVNFLYCVPQYPAPIKPYISYSHNKRFTGISDHTRNTELLKIIKEYKNIEWFEIHVKLNNECIENLWSKTFEEIKEIL